MDNCSSCDKCMPRRVNTDRVRLRHLKNVKYVDLDPDHINKYEIVHFKLYYLCPVCGFSTLLEKDEAPYAAIKFMANYPCYNCFNVCDINDGFMVIVSPDKGVGMNSGLILTEEEHAIRMAALDLFNEVEKAHPWCGNA